MPTFADIDFRLSLRPRANNGQAIDFTPWVERLERRKSLRDSTVGVWSAELAFGDDYQSREAERLLRSRVRDNDWGELELTDRTNGARSVWEILTDARDMSEVYAPDASAGRSWGLHGRDWAKCLVDGEVRLGAFFQSASTIGVAEFNDLLVVQQVTVIPPEMPGFVDFETWDKLMRAAAEGSALGMTASKPLRECLEILLWGMWVDPDGDTLLSKLHAHGWSQFGPVPGCPWQLMNLTQQQQTVTPDRVLRQYGNLDFNEIIYSQNPDNGAPLVIYRPRPFLPGPWSRLPIVNLVGDGSRVLTVNVSQSGAERLTYYRPNAVAAGIHGLDVIIDTRTGRLPIIERSQLKYHGVRPGEPTDDLWPPAEKASEPMLEWFRRRIGIFRRWYYWNAEYLSGTLTLSPADPRVQVGTRVLFPCEWEFQLGGGRYLKTQVVEAYVTDVADTVSDSESGRETVTQVSVIRGQPPGGFRVPAVERWTSGAKRIVTAVKGDGQVLSIDNLIEVYDQGLTSDTVGNATIPVVMCANDNNTLVLYVGDYPNMEAFFSRTHRPDPAVLAGGVSLSSAQPMVGTTVWVNVTVWNLEGDPLTDLAVCLMIDSVAVENATVAYLAAGHSSIVGFSHMAAEGETVVTVAVDPDQAIRETFETNNQQSVPMLVRTPGVTLTSDVSSQSAEPDETAIFNLTITNEGNTAFSFCLSNSEPESGWIIDLGGSPEGIYTVPAGSSTVATVEVTVPEDETPGARAFSVLATCVERSSVNDSVTLMVDVIRFGELIVVSPDGGDVEPTMPEVYTFTVSNSANSNETFAVSASDLLGWDLVASHDELELAPGEEAEVSVLVTPARYDPPGTLNTLTLTLSSMNLTWNTCEGNVLMIVGHHWEVDAGLTDQAFLNMSVPDEREVRYTLDVTNLGNSDDVFRLSLSGIDGFWAVLNTTYVFLEAGGEQRVYLSLTPGADVLAGAYAFNVTIVSESDSSATETLEMGVSVLPFYDISVSADYSQVSLRRGETAYVNLTVRNIGNSADVVDLYAYVDDLNTTTATVGGEVVVLEAGNAVLFALEPGESATIMLTIPVPDDAESGLRELYIDLSSMTDPSVTASQAVSVLVEEDPSWLSLWIILIIVGVAAAVVVLVVFLILRKRRAEEAAREEEQRKMQARRRPPGPPRAKPKAP